MRLAQDAMKSNQNALFQNDISLSNNLLISVHFRRGLFTNSDFSCRTYYLFPTTLKKTVVGTAKISVFVLLCVLYTVYVGRVTVMDRGTASVSYTHLDVYKRQM